MFVECLVVLILLLGQQGAPVALGKKKISQGVILAPYPSLESFDSLTPGSWPGRRRW